LDLKLTTTEEVKQLNIIRRLHNQLAWRKVKGVRIKVQQRQPHGRADCGRVREMVSREYLEREGASGKGLNEGKQNAGTGKRKNLIFGNQRGQSVRGRGGGTGKERKK